MLTRDEAEVLVSDWLRNTALGWDKDTLMNMVDAHVVLHYPVPQPLVAQLSAILQETAPERYVVKVEPYQGRVRVMYIKAKAAAQWAARPPEEHD